MADSEPGAAATNSRRARRRRRRVRNVVSVVAIVAIVGGVLAVATGLVSVGGTDHPSAAGVAPVAAGATSTTTTLAKSTCRTPITVQDPLRLWVGGDSLAGSLGPSLGTITGATGVVQPYFDSRVSSGLSNPGFFDWPTHATTEMTRLDPEVVVFIIGTNDWMAPLSDNWKAGYAQDVENMVKILIGNGRTVYWVSAPILKDTKMDAGVQQVNAVAAGVIAKHPEAHFVDSYKLFSDTNGEFSTNLPDETGKVVTMRAGDGVHLTVDGGDYLARAVYKLVDAQCRVTAQKVSGATKQTIETEGSTQVAGGSSGSGSGSSGSGSSGSGSSGGGTTVQTTPPATAPSTTAPQVTPPTTTAAPPPTTTTPPPPTTTGPG